MQHKVNMTTFEYQLKTEQVNRKLRDKWVIYKKQIYSLAMAGTTSDINAYLRQTDSSIGANTTDVASALSQVA